MYILYVHWHQAEAEAAVSALRSEAHDVQVHWSAEEHLCLGDRLPEAVVISLERLPSHGRAIAEWFQEAKKRRAIPLVFVGGKPDKVAATTKKFPEAVYCTTEELTTVVADIAG